ncbi:hypothetical protein GOP47_0006989 [Adiantum capillus-veneris]|uniref:Uncharacterized protein n=1 Tax=Adiantum capillus-veneris TaxID=13818 RepID=A0A9D4V0G8_ADICA|nr:hypothetical protein GOP47_0006989 [Adiantum capillus-veneris]
MASTTVAMAGIVSPTTPALNSAAKVSTSVVPSFKPAMLPIRTNSSSQPACQCSHRALFFLLATATPAAIFAKEALVVATIIKVEGPPPPSGGLPGTDNADQARGMDLPLKKIPTT